MFLLSRSDTGCPECWLRIKHVSVEIGGGSPPAAPDDLGEEAILGRIEYIREQIPTQEFREKQNDKQP